jgi:GTPase SAR1 family protein
METFHYVYFVLTQAMWNCKYIETSAKTGSNVHELFEELLKMEKTTMISLEPIEETKKKKKCRLM